METKSTMPQCEVCLLPGSQHHKDDPFSPFHSALPNPHSFGELSVRNKSGWALFNRGSSSVQNYFKSLHLSLSNLQIIIQNLRGLGFWPFLLEQDEGKVNSLALCTTTVNMQLFHFVATFTWFESKCESFEIILWKWDWPYKEILQVWHQRINRAPTAQSAAFISEDEEVALTTSHVVQNIRKKVYTK